MNRFQQGALNVKEFMFPSARVNSLGMARSFGQFEGVRPNTGPVGTVIESYYPFADAPISGGNVRSLVEGNQRVKF